MKLDRSHLDAATKHERDLIAAWLDDLGFTYDTVIGIEVERGWQVGTVTDHEQSWPCWITRQCPRAALLTLWDRIGPVEDATELRRRDADIDFADKFREEP